MRKLLILLFVFASVTAAGQATVQTSPGSRTGDTTLAKGFWRMPDIPSGVGTKSVRVDASGKFFATDTSVALSYGSYTPTMTNVTGTSGLTASECWYSKVGNIVTVGFKVSGTCTASANNQFRFTVPVGGNFTTATQAWGSGASSDGTNNSLVGRLLSYSGGTTVLMSFDTGAGTTGFGFSGTMVYQAQ